PTEFEPGSALRLDEVDFRSPAWMACLAEIQGWLRLPEELGLDDQEQFLEALTRGLGFDDSGAAIVSTDGSPRLNAAALDRLNTRLQRAVQLQGEFQANLEAEGASPASATGQWLEAWDDDTVEEVASGPVSAKADIWSISDFSS